MIESTKRNDCSPLYAWSVFDELFMIKNKQRHGWNLSWSIKNWSIIQHYFPPQFHMQIFNYIDTVVVFVIPFSTIVILNTFTALAVWKVAGVRRTMTMQKRQELYCVIFSKPLNGSHILHIFLENRISGSSENSRTCWVLNRIIQIFRISIYKRFKRVSWVVNFHLRKLFLSSRFLCFCSFPKSSKLVSN